MTELETAIRDALHSRADTFVPHETELRSRRPRRWLPPTIAAAVVVLLAVTAALLVTRRTASDQPPASSGTGFVGYRWKLVAIDDSHGHASVPGALHANIGFSRDGKIFGDDSVNAWSGVYRLTKDGYEVLKAGGTDVGRLGGVSLRARVVAAIDACFYTAWIRPGPPYPPTRVQARVSGTTLTLKVAGTTLTLERGIAVPLETSVPSSTKPTSK
jgi:hypothetical protein